MSKFNVLFVDDEINILNSINRITIEENFKALFATSGEKALEQFKENEIAVIVSDMRMPQMNGLELLEKVKEISPNTIRMVLSGYAQISQVIATVNKVGVFKYITKPWNNEEEFLPAIQEALYYYNLQKENELFKIQIEEKNKLYKKILDSNNNLVKNSKNDIESIKKITKKFFDLKNNLFQNFESDNKNNQKSKNINDLMDNIYFQYLETIPNIMESFKLSEYNNKFKDLEEKKITLIFEDDAIKNVNYFGNKKIMELILNCIIKVITNNCAEEDIVLNFTYSNSLNINFLIKNKSDFQKMINNVETKLVFNILDNISGNFECKLSIIPEKFLISINTNLQIRN